MSSGLTSRKRSRLRGGAPAAVPAQRVAEAVFDAAVHFGYRLPELFCGFPRGDHLAPIPYPTSCSPQAWAAAAPLQLLSTLLRIAPATRRRAPAVRPGPPRPLPSAPGGRPAARKHTPDHRRPPRQLAPDRPRRHRKCARPPAARPQSARLDLTRPATPGTGQLESAKYPESEAAAGPAQAGHETLRRSRRADIH